MTFLRVIGFSVVLLGFYALFAQTLPQVEPDLSDPVEVSTDGLDMEGMIALGESLFTGKGTCTLCHNGMGRAPDTLEMDLAATFPSRLADPKYTGVSAGKTGPEAIEDYIRESMQHPSAYVVAGFGKKGSNDTESPMPTVDKAPIELSPVEMNAVIAFLQDRAGLNPTVPLPSADEAPVAEEPATEGMVEAPVTDALAAIDKYNCAACHNLKDSGADLGPELGGIANRMTRAQVMEAILDPNATIAKGFSAGLMPEDFSDEMHTSELLLIVDYLLALPEPAPQEETDEEEPLATTALEVIDKFGCAGCHDLDGSEADVGPRLQGVGQRMTREELKSAITNPNATIAKGFEPDMMPDDFGETIADSEMPLLLDYLMNLSE